MFQALDVCIIAGETWHSGRWSLLSLRVCAGMHGDWAQANGRRGATHFSWVELRSLVTPGSSQSSLQRGHQWQPQRKVTRGRVPGSNTEQKALLQYEKRLGSFQNIDNGWFCLQLSENQFCCVSLSECSWHNFRGVWYLQNKTFLIHTASSQSLVCMSTGHGFMQATCVSEALPCIEHYFRLRDTEGSNSSKLLISMVLAF